MKIEIKVPVLSESVSEATLLQWQKSQGSQVKKDEHLVDLETDKVVLEITAPHAGVLTTIAKQSGEAVRSEEVIAIIDTEAKPSVAAGSPEPATTKTAPASAAVMKSDSRDEAVVIAPAARKMIEEYNLDAAAIRGTGRDGRITKADVLKALEKPAPAEEEIETAPHVSDTVMPGERPEQVVPMTRLRATVAKRLKYAQDTAAILTTFNEVNMKPVMDLRSKYRDVFEKEHDTKLGFMSFFVKASVQALKKFPVVNASIKGENIVYHGYYDIGIAIGSSRGLVVPIIRDADGKSFAEIEREIVSYGQQAQEGRLSLDDLKGGTFSITNGGIFGSMLSTPIINPPQSAILGMHKIQDRPVVEGGQIVIRPIMYLALSYDHRIIDGREAVQFLVTIKDALEDPSRLLLDI